jgi:lipoate synthase
MSDKKREYHRSIEVLQHIKETQPLYYILAFIYDSGYDKKDIVEMMKIIEVDKKTNKVS